MYTHCYKRVSFLIITALLICVAAFMAGCTTTKVSPAPVPVSAPTTPQEQLLNADLQAYATLGQTDRVASLLEQGANVNAKERTSGKTPLMSAAWMGQVKTVKLLLERGAAVNAKTSDGYTALIMAITRGETGTVKLLLDSGADVNIKCQKGHTALHYAKHKGNNEIIKLLKAAGAK